MNGFILKDETFRELSGFIYEKSGIFIPPSKKYLVENRLAKLIQDHKLNGYEDYLYLVKYSSNGNELARLFDAITTNETYFFREPHHFEALAGEIIPGILKARAGAVRIWSAACSTGEEAYTIVMLLKEKMPNVQAEVRASDISQATLASAKRGLYNSYSVRNAPEAYLRKYFRKHGQETYELDEAIRSRVRFRNINLMDRSGPGQVGAVDVIFCRNVLIYFDEKAKKTAVSGLYDALRPGGYLFIGSSESLHSVTRAFKPVSINKTVAYQKV
ncbi:MAG: protein-glutamate O-methyltransferase CheR [Thermodesulfovibrionales bacterium]